MPARATEIHVELGNDASNQESFSVLADADGMITVAGFGSLLSETSARSTFDTVSNFRQGRLRGFRRVFAHAAPIFFTRGIAREETLEYSSLSVEPTSSSSSIVVTLFEMHASEVPAFIERELEFRFLAVQPEPLDAGSESGGVLRSAVLCARFSDEEFRRDRCRGSEAEYEARYGRFGIDRIWDDRLLPCRVYLRHCVLASRALGPEAERSFLDDTFLADRETPIREHLRRNPDILEELPPPELGSRYSG